MYFLRQLDLQAQALADIGNTQPGTMPVVPQHPSIHNTRDNYANNHSNDPDDLSDEARPLLHAVTPVKPAMTRVDATLCKCSGLVYQASYPAYCAGKDVISLSLC